MLKQRINSQGAEKKDDLLRSSLAVILCKTQKYSLLIVKTLRGPPSLFFRETLGRQENLWSDE